MSMLGNDIFINQNSPVVSQKIGFYHNALAAQSAAIAQMSDKHKKVIPKVAKSPDMRPLDEESKRKHPRKDEPNLDDFYV